MVVQKIVECPSRNFLLQKFAWHQQLRCKAVGLNLLLVDALAGIFIAKFYDSLVHMHFVEVIQHEVANLVRNSESLTVRVVQRVDADDGDLALLQKKARHFVVRWRLTNMDAKGGGNRLNINGRREDQVFFE